MLKVVLHPQPHVFEQHESKQQRKVGREWQHA
jgi:hypothetical protein